MTTETVYNVLGDRVRVLQAGDGSSFEMFEWHGPENSGSAVAAWFRSRSITRAVVPESSNDPPAATVRTAPRMSAPRTCFST